VWFVEELKDRVRKHIPFIVIVVAIPNVVLGLAYQTLHVAVSVELSTMQYLFSSLIQGFAALAGLLITIIGFNYQRLRDSIETLLVDARSDGGSLLNQNLGGQNYVSIRNATLSWRNSNYKSTVDSLSKKKVIVRTRHERPSTISFGSDHDVDDMAHECATFRGQLLLLDSLVSHLGRVKLADEGFREKLPAYSILGVISSLLVVSASIFLLAFVDQYGPYYAYVAATAVVLSIVAILYAIAFFRMMLETFFGGGRTKGYAETGIDPPVEGRAIILEIEDMMGWTRTRFGL
jgi:hypothetical protein